MSVTIKDIREGSIVMVRGGFGSEPAVRARVDEVEREIKNGEAGISYSPCKNPSDGRWAYMDQVDRVVLY